MNGVGQGRFSRQEQRTAPGGMRVVVFESNADIRAQLHREIDKCPDMSVVGSAASWPQFSELLDSFVPELVMARPYSIPRAPKEDLLSSSFPVLVQLGLSAGSAAGDSPWFTSLPLPISEVALQNVLACCRAEIYQRKATELSHLFGLYLEGVADSVPYLYQLKVDDGGHAIDLPVEEVVSLAADGNYVRVHTPDRFYEMRTTLTGLSEQLDPRVFARVHRSFIVNLRYVHDVTQKEGASLLILLSNGMEIPVGPNYRQELDNVAHIRSRMTA